jgi:hypothetical protein
MPEGVGEVGLTDAVGAEEDDVGLVLDEGDLACPAGL